MAKKKATPAKKTTAANAKAKKKVAGKDKVSKKASGGSPPPPPASPAMQAVEYLRYLYANPVHAYVNAVRVLERNRKFLSELSPNIVGAEVGLKEFQDTRIRVFAIRILVKEKFCSEDMEKTGEACIPRSIEGIPTDVVKPCIFIEANGKPGDPIYVNKPSPGTGTLGTYVIDDQDVANLLTAAHVISSARGGSKKVKDGSGADIGVVDTSDSAVWQKGLELDAAIITPTTTPSPVPVLRNRTGQKVDELGTAVPGDSLKGVAVWKRGQKTNGREGKILVPDSGVRQLKDGSSVDRQIVVVPAGTDSFAEQGDSGAIVIAGRTAIGIVRAVSEGLNQQGVQEVLVTPFSALIENGIRRFTLP